MRIVFLDFVEALDCFVGSAETQDALVLVEVWIWAGVLDDGGAGAGEVAEGAVADPGSLFFDIGGFGAAEFTGGILNVFSEIVRERGDCVGFFDAPAVIFQDFLFVGVAGEMDGEFQRRGDAFGQVEIRLEGFALIVAVDGSVVIDHEFVHVPVWGGGERRAGFSRGVGGQVVEDDEGREMDAV